MKWSQERIEEAKECLSKNDTVTGALTAMAFRFGESVTSSALRNAFSHYGQESPSNYLGDTQVVTSDEMEEEVVSEAPDAERNWISTDFEKGEYIFKDYYDTQVVTFDEMEEILIKYSNIPPGEGKTAGEIAQHYMGLQKSWASEDFIGWMFRTIGFTKSKYPMPPHKMFNSHEHIMKSAYNRRDAILKQNDSSNVMKYQQKEIERLYDELEEIQRMISNTDATIEESELKTAQYEGDIITGYRVLVPHITDLHNGKLVEETPFSKRQNVFNEEIFDKRIDAICLILTDIARKQGEVYDEVHLAGLGDYFEALLANMRPYHFTTMYNYGADQYRAVKNAWIKVIQTIVREFPHVPINVIVQGGNHDRLTQEREPRSEEVLAFQLAEHLKDYFKDEPRLTIDFGAAVVSIMYPNMVNHIFIHGHLPKLKSEASYQAFIALHGLPGALRTVISSGHYHCAEVQTGPRMRVFRNPSVCGDDGYNLHQLTTGSEPEIMMVDICDRHDRVVGPYNLHFNLSRAL